MSEVDEIPQHECSRLTEAATVGRLSNPPNNTRGSCGFHHHEMGTEANPEADPCSRRSLLLVAVFETCSRCVGLCRDAAAIMSRDDFPGDDEREPRG